jgi:hypothetical protein
MKNLRKSNFGMVLMYVFSVSTVVLMVLLALKLMPDRINTVINIWLVELFLVIGYCLFFYDARQVRKGGRKNISVLKH